MWYTWKLVPIFNFFLNFETKPFPSKYLNELFKINADWETFTNHNMPTTSKLLVYSHFDRSTMRNIFIMFLSLMLEINHTYFERNGKSCCRLTFSTSSSLVKIISSISSCKLVKWGCQLIDWLYLLLILHPMWFLWQQVSSNRILWTASES